MIVVVSEARGELMPNFYDQVTFREVSDSDWPMLEIWLNNDSAVYQALRSEVVAGITGDTHVCCFLILRSQVPIGLIVTRNTWNPLLPWSDTMTLQSLIAESEHKSKENHNLARAKFLNTEYDKHWDHVLRLLRANA